MKSQSWLSWGKSEYSIRLLHDIVILQSTSALTRTDFGGNILRNHESRKESLNELGGIKYSMKFTMLSFLICLLALIGIYPLSGFFSKDMIIEYAKNKD